MKEERRLTLKKELLRAFILAIIFALGFGLMATLVSEHKIARFDHVISRYVQSFRTPVLTTVMKGFTFIGTTPVVIVITLVILFMLLFVFKHRAEALLVFSIILGSSIIFEVLKHLFHRQRPTLHRLIEATGYSFPSGHSTEAFALYGILAFISWRHLKTPIARTLMIFFASVMILAIGTSRIYLGVHFPSDVLAGYLASGFWLATVIWFYQRYKERRYEKEKHKYN